MHKVPFKNQKGEYSHYYVGRFIDRLGTSHWLVVRKAPIQTLQGDTVIGNPQADVEYFYEVITNTNIIGQVKSKLRSRRNAGKSKE